MGAAAKWSATACSAAACRAPAGADFKCDKQGLLVRRRADLADFPLTCTSSKSTSSTLRWLSEVVSLACDLGEDGSSFLLLRYPLTRLDSDWKRPLFGGAAFSDMLLRLRRLDDYRARPSAMQATWDLSKLSLTDNFCANATTTCLLQQRKEEHKRVGSQVKVTKISMSKC